MTDVLQLILVYVATAFVAVVAFFVLLVGLIYNYVTFVVPSSIYCTRFPTDFSPTGGGFTISADRGSRGYGPGIVFSEMGRPTRRMCTTDCREDRVQLYQMQDGGILSVSYGSARRFGGTLPYMGQQDEHECMCEFTKYGDSYESTKLHGWQGQVARYLGAFESRGGNLCWAFFPAQASAEQPMEVVYRRRTR